MKLSVFLKFENRLKKKEEAQMQCTLKPATKAAKPLASFQKDTVKFINRLTSIKSSTDILQLMIEDYFKNFNILTDEEIAQINHVATKRALNKIDYFIRQGETCKEVAFILSGTLRSFYVSDKGEEITYCITFPNNLMTAYSSFITGQYTEENIQAITNVEMLTIPKNKIDALANQNPNWMKFLKLVAEQQYIELEKRIFQLQKNNALQRYSDLLKNQPEYIEKIPLQYLASYLGVSQRHLSRIRREISF
jgi:CRP-like cAMP-binding protein